MIAWLRRLADAFMGRTGKPSRLDTATRMAMDADFSGSDRPPQQNVPTPAEPVDPIEELERIIGKREPPPRPKAQTFPRRRRDR